MYTKAQIISNGKDTKFKKFSFMGEDVSAICHKLKMRNANIAEIYRYYQKGYSVEDCKEMVKKDLENLEKDHDYQYTIVLTTSYVPIDEFSPEEYYDETGFGNKNGKPLPLQETLDKYSKMLEELGFININKLVNYEMKVAYIYPNKAAKKVIEYINASW